MLHSWKHSTRHLRRSQEVGRATDQQSIFHVRPWSSQFRIEENSMGSKVWKLCRITKTQESKRLNHGRIAERSFEGRTVQQKTHARTRTHAFRQGKTDKIEMKDGLVSVLVTVMCSLFVTRRNLV